MISTKRYVVLPLNADMALFTFFLYAAYHSPLLHAVSLWSGYNINYTLVPPTRKVFFSFSFSLPLLLLCGYKIIFFLSNAVGFLMEAGQWYRFIMYGSAFLLMFVTRYLGVESFLRLYPGITPQPQPQQKIANDKKDL